MDLKSLAIMQKLLKPATDEQIARVVHACTTPASFEQLTLADAGLEQEVLALIRKEKGSSGLSQLPPKLVENRDVEAVPLYPK